MENTLTHQAKKYFTEIGHEYSDLSQLKRAMSVTDYEFSDLKTNETKMITKQEVIEILGLETYLNGISRSAFHYTAVRYDANNRFLVYFDSSKIFKK